jgi:hypothetical protein
MTTWNLERDSQDGVTQGDDTSRRMLSHIAYFHERVVARQV